MLYLADFLEPGRSMDPAERAMLAQKVPGQRDTVLREVVRRRISWMLRSGWPLPAPTVAFWNQLAEGK
jgi:HD superfamily phosphohydrolase YqeK